MKAFSSLLPLRPVQEPIVDIEPEPDPCRTCPVCSSLLKPVLDPAGKTLPLQQCPLCQAAQPLCELCLYPCSDKDTATCTNNSCQLVATLLSCERVTDLTSKVYGCPQFRACPNCHSLIMHERGCKYVTCTQCSHKYCFICLQKTEECRKDAGKYWSLTCSKPRAARQRFQT
ncbi:probable E3 ubiquitin-protein ligase RNF144A-B [Astyanax mexicanus]|nr:probable E3 ubiquitin-protein ligase RNF144A-B [Astyanax mexicanus]